MPSQGATRAASTHLQRSARQASELHDFQGSGAAPGGDKWHAAWRDEGSGGLPHPCLPSGSFRWSAQRSGAGANRAWEMERSRVVGSGGHPRAGNTGRYHRTDTQAAHRSRRWMQHGMIPSRGPSGGRQRKGHPVPRLRSIPNAIALHAPLRSGCHIRDGGWTWKGIRIGGEREGCLETAQDTLRKYVVT